MHRRTPPTAAARRLLWMQKQTNKLVSNSDNDSCQYESSKVVIISSSSKSVKAAQCVDFIFNAFLSLQTKATSTVVVDSIVMQSMEMKGISRQWPSISIKLDLPSPRVSFHSRQMLKRDSFPTVGDESRLSI